MGENENFHRNGILLGKLISGESPEFQEVSAPQTRQVLKTRQVFWKVDLNPIN